MERRTTLASGSYIATSAVIYIKPATAVTVTIPGPVEVLALRGSQWYKIGELAGGAPSIVVSEFEGYCERANLGGGWSRLALVASGALTGGNATVELVGEEVL